MSNTILVCELAAH